MDFGFCGIIDIIFIVLLIFVIIFGYKKGFLNKAIGLVGLFVGLVVAVAFCTQLAGWFESTGMIYNSIYDNIKENVLSADIFTNPIGTTATIKEVLMNMGMPEFFANMFAGNIQDSFSVETVAINISRYFSHIAMVVISFFILFVGVFILAFLLKILAKILRGNAFIKFIDGILGIVLYGCMFMLVVYVIFTIMRLMGNAEFFAPVQSFLEVDIKLNDPDAFRLSKFFYEHNIIYAILDIFF